MKKSVLIVGKSCNLTEELVKRYLSAQCNVTLASNNAAAGKNDSEDALMHYDLNKRSPLSARTCILQVLNRFEAIDQAIVINTAEGEKRPLHELPPAPVEEVIDASIKGMFFILKEALQHFMRQKSGTLSLISYTYGEEVLTPVDAAVHGSFHALADSLFTYYRNEPVLINGFESQSQNAAEFASYIRETIEEKGEKSYGKWYRYHERGGFFSAIPIPGLKK